jgi:PAS domain S-box-containing protein
MTDLSKTNQELTEENALLKERILELEQAESERQRIEEAFKDSELKYRSLIEHSSDVVFCVDKNGEYKFVNQVFASTFGKTPDYFLGKSFWDIYPKEHADHRQATSIKVFETGESQSVEVVVPLSDRTLHYIAKANPVRDETGKVVLNVTHAIDITERKLMEEALRESEEKLSAMFQSIPDHVSVMDKELNLVWANEHAIRTFGTDIIGKKCYEAYHRRKEPCEPYPCLTLKAFEEGGIHEHEIEVIDKAGKTIYFHCTSNVASRDKDGKPTTVIEISRDITKHKQEEAQLWENEKRLRLVLQSAKLAFVDWDVQNDHLYYSDLHFKILGYSRDELEPRLRSWNRLIHPQDKTKVIRTLKNHLDGRTDHYEAIYRLKMKSSGWRWFRCHAEVVNRDDKGNPLRMMGTITDATSEKEIEQELEKKVAERTAELVELNAALKILLKQREQDKVDTEETMAANLKLMVLPHLHSLKKCNLHDRQKVLVSLIDENLSKVSSPFINKLSSKYSILTPKELQVAGHIRMGKTSKEIAEIMNLSSRTVDVFRYSLRKKLGLNNKKTNLQSLLSSL